MFSRSVDLAAVQEIHYKLQNEFASLRQAQKDTEREGTRASANKKNDCFIVKQQNTQQIINC